MSRFAHHPTIPSLKGRFWLVISPRLQLLNESCRTSSGDENAVWEGKLWGGISPYLVTTAQLGRFSEQLNKRLQNGNRCTLHRCCGLTAQQNRFYVSSRKVEHEERLSGGVQRRQRHRVLPVAVLLGRKLVQARAIRLHTGDLHASSHNQVTCQRLRFRWPAAGWLVLMSKSSMGDVRIAAEVGLEQENFLRAFPI